MFGPKLNARSYAVLVLAAIGLLAGGYLGAQTRSSAESSAEIAAATRQVADATRQVAESNGRIAESIRDLASAVRSASAQRPSSGEAAPGGSTSSDETMIRPGDRRADRSEGTFELGTTKSD